MSKITWTSVDESLPIERKRVAFVVLYRDVPTHSGKIIPLHEVAMEGWYIPSLSTWFKWPPFGSTHIGEAIRNGQVIKWRYL